MTKTVRKVTAVFQPQQISKLWMIRERRQGSPWAFNTNFKLRSNYVPAGWTKHQNQFAKRFSRLHYLACHSPKPIAIKWRSVYNQYMKKNFGVGGKASTRYLNKYSCHSWL